MQEETNMKVEFKFDSEKMRALKMYTEQKGVSIEAELAQAAEALYQKHVPGNVKAFIEGKSRGNRSKRKPQGSSASAVGAPSGN